MNQIERHQRVRRLVKNLNRQRKQQARQLDILCNDVIGAQRGFLRRLQELSFATELYRVLLGGTDLHHVLTRVGRVLKQELPGAGVAFFIRQPDGCEVHACPSDEALCSDHAGPHECFEPELVDLICKENRPCTLEDIAGLSTEGIPETLTRFSLVTLPLSDLGRSVGFVLLSCPLPQVLSTDDVRRISPALSGLAQALRPLRAALPMREGPSSTADPVWGPE